MADNKPSAQITLYGHWDSRLDAASIFQRSETIGFPRPGRHGLFFLLNMTEENNDVALMHLDQQGALQRVSPPGFSLRSRVHEYGGLSYCFTDRQVFYCNYSDQGLYKQEFPQAAGKPGAVTRLATEEGARYGDFLADSGRARLICVRETHQSGAEVVNALVAIPMESGGAEEVLFDDSDFVSSPALSPCGRWLAFISWNHPNMPWDATSLWLASLDSQGRIETLRSMPQSSSASVLQPRFNASGDLYFIADWNDWWNIYRIDATAISSGLSEQSWPAQAMAPLQSECCPPPWQLGQRSYDFPDRDSLLFSINLDGYWSLGLNREPGERETILIADLGSLEHVSAGDGKAWFCAATPSEPACLFRCEPASTTSPAPVPVYRPKIAARLGPEEIAVGRHFRFSTGTAGGGEFAFGIFYPPTNPRYQAPAGTLPPLLVNVHGGPTSSASTAYNPIVQFWTSRGFAVVDVNHRGSTGYGRKFRRSLYRHWGEFDIDDVIHAVEHLIDRQMVAPGRIAIRGGSAGGYAVLAALSSCTLFGAGTSYYGISDLELLARDTHKFESRYPEQLIGPYPEAKDLYQQRSPIHRIERIKAPVLLLQGEEDKVVPPNQAEAIYEKLRDQNPASRYLLFPGEAHGFRRPENQIAALEAELGFYQANLL